MRPLQGFMVGSGKTAVAAKSLLPLTQPAISMRRRYSEMVATTSVLSTPLLHLKRDKHVALTICAFERRLTF